MTRTEILEQLYYCDPRNPDHTGEPFMAEERCLCDNCFYGRTALANELLKEIDKNERHENNRK